LENDLHKHNASNIGFVQLVIIIAEKPFFNPVRNFPDLPGMAGRSQIAVKYNRK